MWCSIHYYLLIKQFIILFCFLLLDQIPLSVAIKHKSNEIARFLIDHGADVNAMTIL